MTVKVPTFSAPDCEAELQFTSGLVSMLMLLLAPREPAAPGEARVKVAEFPAKSLIVPEFKVKESVPT